MLSRRARWVAIAVAAGLLLWLPVHLSPYTVYVLTTMLVFAIFAMSLDLLIGYLGYTSFGHAAFFATGAYGAVISAVRLGQSLWLNTGVALGAVLVVALVYGLVALRTRGLPFIMITLALGQALWGVAYRWASVTGGDNGISGLARPTLPWIGQLEGHTEFYYFTLAAFGLVYLMLHVLTSSPLGLSWKGIRDSELRMEALGFNVWLHKYIAYVVSAFFGGVAGVLNAYLTGFVSPEAAFLTNSATAILSVILGGPGTLLGPSLGAGVVILIRQMVSSVTERWPIVLGLVYIGTVMFLPGGILGMTRRVAARWLARLSSGPAGDRQAETASGRERPLAAERSPREPAASAEVRKEVRPDRVDN